MTNIERMRFQRKQKDLELLKLEFEKCIEQRNFEIQNFWTRGWFFGALILAVATAYFQVSKSDAFKGDNDYRIYIAFLGFLISFFQGLMNRGSKYWQERWEAKTKRRESLLGIDVTRTKQFHEKEKYFLDSGIRAKSETWLNRGARWSVSKLTFLIWDLITLSWFMLWVSNWHINESTGLSKFVRGNAWWIVHGAYIVYIILFLFYSKVYGFLLKEIKPDDGRYHEQAYHDSERYIKADEDLEKVVPARLEAYEIMHPVKSWRLRRREKRLKDLSLPEKSESR
jgi:hypothetical protein